MSDPFPYLSVPPHARWRNSMAHRSPIDIDPHAPGNFTIQPTDKIASAGSCFAQRIATALRQSGYNYLTVESGSPFQNEDERKRLGYGLYSARYGNVYTALQLLQLFRRAYGRFTSEEPLWRLPQGTWVDPYRPAVQPEGFESESLCLWDREAHLAAVRKMFEEVDLFIFTLGLTEAWCSTVDGSVFAACPGSSLGGEFDRQRYAFHNFSVAEVVKNLEEFLGEFGEINPRAKVLLTVSPVPLLATYEPRHVLQATVYSKSVLRIAAEEVVRKHDHVHYFASYEIVNHTGDSRSYFQEDLRDVSDAAVSHVIKCFHQQFTTYRPDIDAPVHSPAPAPRMVADKPLCDEELMLAALADQAQGEQQVQAE